MLLKDISLSTPQENILYDDVLLYLAEQKKMDEVLRFWESPEYFIVLGRICKEHEDLCWPTIKEDRILVLRRSSGGGTVVQGPGCLNYTLVLSKDKAAIADLRKSYAYILGKVVEALSLIGLKTTFLPISDIAMAETQKKISGNAQKRGKNFILHHGTILYNFDLPKIERYLKMPKDMPDYRQRRSHLDFVANVHASRKSIQDAFKKVFAVRKEETQLSEMEKTSLNQFLNTKSVVVELK